MSGVRLPEKQALLMYKKRIATGRFTRYKNKTLFKDIKKAFNEAYSKHKTSEQIINAMATVIQLQVSQGKYISPHLNSHAVDIQSKYMSSQQKDAFWIASKKVAIKVLLKNNPPHWHVQFG